MKIVVIAVVDALGGFSKDGKLPWNFPADLRWFKNRTSGHICVMGRKTYEDINERLGEKAITNVLPGRECYVVSTTLTELSNAKVIKNLYDIYNVIDPNEKRTIYIIGGERLFRLGLNIADSVLLTIINKDYGCDKFFPTEYLVKTFNQSQLFMPRSDEDKELIRFTTWKRKETELHQVNEVEEAIQQDTDDKDEEAVMSLIKDIVRQRMKDEQAKR